MEGKLMAKFKGNKKICIALDARDEIAGVWWRGCVQPKSRWKAAIQNVSPGARVQECYLVPLIRPRGPMPKWLR
jgi:hypothetical protein